MTANTTPNTISPPTTVAVTTTPSATPRAIAAETTPSRNAHVRAAVGLALIVALYIATSLHCFYRARVLSREAIDAHDSQG